MLGYYGPEGTFTHQALLSLGLPDPTTALPTVSATLDAVRSGEISAGLVPIENSVEGGVSATLDNLASGDPLVIVREVVIGVTFNLCARPGATLASVRRVITHPHAMAQCRDWVHANLPHAQVTESGSTAGAAKEVADPESRYDAAICAPIAGDLYGLTPLAVSIADNASAVTRFVLVARPGTPPPASGADKTSLVVYMREDHPGALLEILEQFASRGVNLSRIESRPTKTTLGSYYFSIDADGHVNEARMAEAMMGLHRTCKDVVYLGSYPRADKVRPRIPEGYSDGDFREAELWMRGLKGE